MEKIFDSSDSIVAQSTPIGEGAIGIVRLSGPQSLSFLKKIFYGKINPSGESPLGEPPSQFDSHRLYFGKIVHPQTGEMVDQVMAVYMKSPTSFTGEDLVEIHAHGNNLILQKIIGLLVDLGARLAEPGEFSKRAFLNGKIDLCQAEALADLISSKSDWQAKNALLQLKGALAKSIKGLRQKLIDLLALVEAGFDFSEEDIEIINRQTILESIRGIENEVDRLLDSFKTGQLYKDGLRVALIGKPNVGKSSLLNVLLNEEKAIVHEVPGTTRDIVTGERKINGIIATFYDTAGIREANSEVEREGVKRSMELINKTDLILLLLDSSRPLEKEDFDLIQKGGIKPCIIIYSKIDLPPRWEPNSSIIGEKPFVKISSKENRGISELVDEIYDIVIKKNIENDHNYVLNNVRHHKKLFEVKNKLQNINYKMTPPSLSDECLAEELRIILNNLGEITGEVTNNQILDEIFSRFCIGK